MSDKAYVIRPGEGPNIVVIEDGVETITFNDGYHAASTAAMALAEIRRLKQVINAHAGWLCSRTPDQVNHLDAGQLRQIAQELRFNGQVQS